MSTSRRPATLILLLVSYTTTLFVVGAALQSKFQAVSWAAEFRIFVLVIFSPIILKYIIYLFLAVGYRFHQPASGNLEGPLPRMSVLIPAWNEEMGVAGTIRSVLATRYPNLEIIVINDGSTDATELRVRKTIAEHAADKGGAVTPIHYRVQRNCGKARALNNGLAIATGEIVVTIDADSVMDPGFLNEVARYFARHDVAAAAGNVAIGNRHHPTTVVQQLEYLYGFFFKRAEAVMGAVYIVGGAAAAYRREIVTRLGGFDERIITEDIELSTRLQRHGFRVGYITDAIVYTEGPSDLFALCRQRLRWKYGRLQTFARHRSLFFSRGPNHSCFLTFLVLPTALYAEFLLLLEPALLVLFFIYTWVTADFAPLAAFIAILGSVIVVQVWADPKPIHHRNLLALSPVAWILFYGLDAVEYQALVRSIRRLAAGRELHWQRWKRCGVYAKTAE